jgi:predicted transcriptional regulator
MVECDVSAFVVKINGIVAGILCDIDLVKSIVCNDDLHAVTVADVMTVCELVTEEGAVNPCAQIDERESVKNALKVLDAAGTHNLLVAGSNERDAGLVSIRGLLKLVLN